MVHGEGTGGINQGCLDSRWGFLAQQFCSDAVLCTDQGNTVKITIRKKTIGAFLLSMGMMQMQFCFVTKLIQCSPNWNRPWTGYQKHWENTRWPCQPTGPEREDVRATNHACWQRSCCQVKSRNWLNSIQRSVSLLFYVGTRMWRKDGAERLNVAKLQICSQARDTISVIFKTKHASRATLARHNIPSTIPEFH